MPADVPNTLPGVDGPVSFVVVSAVAPPSQQDETGTDASTDQEDEAHGEERHVLRLTLAEGKKGQLTFLQTILPASTHYIMARLQRGDAVCVCCDSGKDTSVGIALAALQLFFDDQGQLREPGAAGAYARSLIA